MFFGWHQALHITTVFLTWVPKVCLNVARVVTESCLLLLFIHHDCALWSKARRAVLILISAPAEELLLRCNLPLHPTPASSRLDYL